jgi:acyl-coenzyme A thioesterase PaaI-like protein
MSNTEPARQSFFVADGDTLVPQELAKGPWGRTLHGRVFGALCARAVDERLAADPGLICSRLTVDIFRAATLDPVRVTSRVVREGRRIVVLEVRIEQESGPVGEGKAVLLRRGEQPPGDLLATPRWDVPTPEQMGSPRPPMPGRTPMWDSWLIADVSDTEFRLRGGLWMREIHDLVEGEPLTPMTRLGAAGDVAHPVANSSTVGLGFINADYTIYIGREPRGDVLGIQPYGHVSADGVASAQCVVHDLDGPVGFFATTAIANSMARANSASAAESAGA